MMPLTADSRFCIENETLAIDGLSRSYRLMHLSDSHLNLDSPLDTEENRAKAAHLREVWMAHGNGIAAEENYDLLVRYGKDNAADLFVFTGDMTDFPSVGTAAAGKEKFDQAGTYLYAPGNHEQAFRFPAYYQAATNGSPALQVYDLDELRFVAVDNAAHSVPDEVMDTLESVLRGDKPVILLHHTPVDCETLHPAAVAHWQDVTYFLFGMPGDGDNMQRYIDLLTKEKTQLKAVIAGHLHMAHVDTFENGVVQYIAAPCLAGYGRVIDIVGK